MAVAAAAGRVVIPAAPRASRTVRLIALVVVTAGIGLTPARAQAPTASTVPPATAPPATAPPPTAPPPTATAPSAEKFVAPVPDPNLVYVIDDLPNGRLESILAQTIESSGERTFSMYDDPRPGQDTTAIVSATRTAVPPSSNSQRTTIGTRQVWVEQAESDGSIIGWNAMFREGDVTVLITVYDLDKAAFERAVASTHHPGAAKARRLVAATDGRYRSQFGPTRRAVIARTATTARIPWKLTVYVPPGYPMGEDERRDLCWQLSSGTTKSRMTCPGFSFIVRTSKGPRVVVIPIPPGTRAARASGYSLASNDPPATTPPTPLKADVVSIKPYLGTALVVIVPAATCFVTAEFEPPSIRPFFVDGFDRNDPDDPCRQSLLRGLLVPVTRLAPTAAPQ